MLDYSRNIERYFVAANSVAAIASSSARTGRSDETVADFVVTVDDEDESDDDWSHSENWEHAHRRS